MVPINAIHEKKEIQTTAVGPPQIKTAKRSGCDIFIFCLNSF